MLARRANKKGPKAPAGVWGARSPTMSVKSAAIATGVRSDRAKAGTGALPRPA